MAYIDNKIVDTFNMSYDTLANRSNATMGLSPASTTSSGSSVGHVYYEAQSAQSSQFPPAQGNHGPPQDIWSPLRPSYPPTAEDWRAYRSIFTQLYNVENKTLKDVMRIMEERFGFRATRRMFLQRITNWNLCKNYKAEERAKVVQTYKQHDKQGHSHHNSMVRTRPLLVERIRRESKDRGQSSRIFQDEQVVEKTTQHPVVAKPKDTVALLLDDLRQRVMQSSKPMSPLSTPAKIKNAEMLLLHTNIFYDSFPQLSNKEFAVKPYDFTNKLDAAFIYLNTGQQKAAWRILNEASDMAQSLLARNDWRTMQYLISNAMDWSLSAPVDPFKSVFIYISSMATLVLGQGNPISVVCTAITNLEAGDEAYMSASRLMLAKLEERLGGNHKEVQAAKDLHSIVLTIGNHFDEAQPIQRELLRYHTAENPLSQEAVWVYYRLGLTCLKLADYEGAVRPLQDVLTACDIIDPLGFPHEAIEVPTMRDLYTVMSFLGRVAEIQSILERILVKCVTNKDWEVGDWRTVAIVGLLERCLREQGKVDEADQLKEQHPEAF